MHEIGTAHLLLEVPQSQGSPKTLVSIYNRRNKRHADEEIS